MISQGTARMIRSAQLMVTGFALWACAAPSPRPRAPSSQGGPPLIEFRLVHGEPSPDLERIEYGGESLYLERRPIISDADLVAVRPSVHQDRVLLDMQLSPEGSRRLIRVTRENIGQRIALLVGSRVRLAPVIRSTVGPRLQAVVELSATEVERILRRIRARWPEREGAAERRG